MRIHHLNCGTCCPLGGRLFDGDSDSPLGRLVCHCLLVEAPAGLVLVDTGFGTRDVARPRHLSPFFRLTNNPRLRPEETALAQVERLGFDRRDVRHIVATHLDFDHAGGLDDFPEAAVHVLAREKEVAEAAGGGFIAAQRYRPEQWDAVRRWHLHPSGGGEPWYGFDAVRDLPGLPPEILLVPLAGHTAGHSGVAVREDDGRWLLYASDAYFYRGELGPGPYLCTPGLRGYQAMMEFDRAARLLNQRRLRRLSLDRDGEIRIFCAHDPVEFDLLSGAAS